MNWKISNVPCPNPSCPTCQTIKARREAKKILRKGETKDPFLETNMMKAAEADIPPLS